VSHRALAVVILIGLGIAAATSLQAGVIRFSAMMSTPVPGPFGTSWGDLGPPAMRAEARARAQALYDEAAWAQRVSLACAALSLAGIVVAAWRNRRDVRSWHWLSFLSLGLLLTTFAMASATSGAGPDGLGLVALLAVALAASVIDLRRGKWGAPGRPVAWVTLLLSLVLGLLVLTGA
jgi:hypothetical protein